MNFIRPCLLKSVQINQMYLKHFLVFMTLNISPSFFILFFANCLVAAYVFGEEEDKVAVKKFSAFFASFINSSTWQLSYLGLPYMTNAFIEFLLVVFIFLPWCTSFLPLITWLPFSSIASVFVLWFWDV